MGSAGPRFDESLVSVAIGLHVVELLVCALVTAWLLFTWLERRGRSRWMEVPQGSLRLGRGPYRSSDCVAAHMLRAPRLVRGAAFGSLAFGHLFAPLIVLAVTEYPFDGVSIPLIPGIALTALNWACAWLLLSRSPHAASAARSGAVGSLMANVGLLAIAGVHFVEVEMQRRDGIEHACSSSVTFVVIVFAVASVIQALVVLAALRSFGGALSWTAIPSRARELASIAGGAQLSLGKDQGDEQTRDRDARDHEEHAIEAAL